MPEVLLEPGFEDQFLPSVCRESSPKVVWLNTEAGEVQYDSYKSRIITVGMVYDNLDEMDDEDPVYFREARVEIPNKPVMVVQFSADDERVLKLIGKDQEVRLLTRGKVFSEGKSGFVEIESDDPTEPYMIGFVFIRPSLQEDEKVSP